MVPMVVRLREAGVCACGQVVAAGERAGSTRQTGRVVCLSCLAGFSAGPDEDGPALQEAPTDSPHAANPSADSASAEDRSAANPVHELPEPVAVVIPADWGPSKGTSLPAWQRSAGVAATLPAPAPATPRPVDPPAPPVVVQFAAPTPAPVPAPAVESATPAPTPAPAAPSVIAVSHEAVAIVGPSHRRRTFLPAGLLALRASRGREPGVTGHPDGTTRAILNGATDAGVLSLHDRRMPGRRGRIAHLAIGASGVYVIEVVRAKNARVEVRPVPELALDGQELVVGGRTMTSTVTATQGRAAIVRSLLDEVGLSAVPVIGVMFFVDAAVPDDSELEVSGVQVVGRTGLPGLVRNEGALGPDHLETLLEYLTERLPAA